MFLTYESGTLTYYGQHKQKVIFKTYYYHLKKELWHNVLNVEDSFSRYKLVNTKGQNSFDGSVFI